MRSIGKCLLAAMLSVASFAFADLADESLYKMYWLVDSRFDESDAKGKVAAEVAKGENSMIPADKSDFNWAKLVAYVNGEKIAINGGQLDADTLHTTSSEKISAVLDKDISGTVASFWVEFYNYSDGSLSLLGWSESITPEQLFAMGALEDMRNPVYQGNPEGGYSSWSPKSFTAVPEPTSGLLLLIGGALLALRRKQKKGAC